MATRKYEGKIFEDGSAENSADKLVVEDALHISINNEPFTITMRSPGNDQFLTRGLLHSEGVLNNASIIPEYEFQHEKEMTSINALVNPSDINPSYVNSRSLLSVSSCGICGKTKLDDLSDEKVYALDDVQLNIESLYEMFGTMQKSQSIFQVSGGSHAAAAFSIDGKMLSIMEDIGRHNAVDKVVGELITLEKLNTAKCLIVSGRISYEIIIKCFKARIPILAAVSAPSSLAVDFAKELGITLLAFCRNNRATCYSNIYRIKNLNLNSQAG